MRVSVAMSTVKTTPVRGPRGDNRARSTMRLVPNCAVPNILRRMGRRRARGIVWKNLKVVYSLPLRNMDLGPACAAHFLKHKDELRRNSGLKYCKHEE